MPLVQPSPWIRYQFFDASGDPLAFGWVYTFVAGTNTPAATYVDHTGTTQNSNPIHLDAGGYADIWLTSASYKIRVEDTNHVALYTIDGLPGLGSLISVGDLSPLFSTDLSGGALTFDFDQVNAYQLFGRFSGSAGDPSYGAVGSDQQVTHNESGQMRGDGNFKWDTATFKLAIGRAGDAAATPALRLIAAAAGAEIHFGTATTPVIKDVSGWEFTSKNAQDINFGCTSNPQSVLIGGGGTVAIGSVQQGEGSHPGILKLNDGNQVAGVWAGANIICGSLATPETFVVAPTGSIYLTTAGGAGTTLWVKETSPTTSTGWVGK